MKFLIGFLTGAAAGAAVVTQMNDAQRENLKSRASQAASKVRSTEAVSAVEDAASSLAETADEQVGNAVREGQAKAEAAMSGSGTGETGSAAATSP